jgi:hypothetical protein
MNVIILQKTLNDGACTCVTIFYDIVFGYVL